MCSCSPFYFIYYICSLCKCVYMNIETAEKKNQLCKDGKSMKRWEWENGKVFFIVWYTVPSCFIYFILFFIFIHNKNCIQWCELRLFCVLWITKGLIKMKIILCLVKFCSKASSNQECCNYSCRIIKDEKMILFPHEK